MSHSPETTTLNLRDSMLQFAHDICAAEVATPDLQPHTVEEIWEPVDLTNPAIFATPLLLESVTIVRPDEANFQVVAAGFSLPAEETSIRITTADDPLDGDSFVRYFYDQFRQAYGDHSHILCAPIQAIPRLVTTRIPGTGRFDATWYNK